MATLRAQHVSRVRILYKTILRLHRGLPLELQAMGDQYVKTEFKRHKEAEDQFVGLFMKEWMNYAITLAKQIGKKTGEKKIGIGLGEEGLSALNEHQVGQLFELFEETQKPRDPDNPMGEHPLVNSQESTKR